MGNTTGYAGDRVKAQGVSRVVKGQLYEAINRLSDWLFTAARFENMIAGLDESSWHSR